MDNTMHESKNNKLK